MLPVVSATALPAALDGAMVLGTPSFCHTFLEVGAEERVVPRRGWLAPHPQSGMPWRIKTSWTLSSQPMKRP